MSNCRVPFQHKKTEIKLQGEGSFINTIEHTYYNSTFDSNKYKHISLLMLTFRFAMIEMPLCGTRSLKCTRKPKSHNSTWTNVWLIYLLCNISRSTPNISSVASKLSALSALCIKNIMSASVCSTLATPHGSL